MKKYVIIALLIILSLILLGFLINPFYQTGIELKAEPNKSYVKIGSETYQTDDKGELRVKLKAGTQKVITYSFGYKRDEREIKIKKYGKTKADIALTRIAPLLADLPYSSPDGKFLIQGKYNDFLEPEYILAELVPKGNEDAKKWLSSKGVNLSKAKIITIIDYELDEEDPPQ